MIALPTLIPSEQWIALSLAIHQGNTDQVKRLVEDNSLDVDAFMDNGPACMPVLMEALLSNGFPTEEAQLSLLRYLLESGANPNIRCRKGYNCLHVAVQQDKYLRALDLFLDFDADVNVPDADGANIVYWAIQRFLLRKEGMDEAQRLEALRVLGKILQLGADLDQQTRYEMTARGWLEHAAPEVRALVARWEEGKPAVHPVRTVQPKFPTHLQFPGVAKKIWDESMKADADGAAVPGELLRMVETLREDAQRHGSGRPRKDQKRMILFVRNKLVRSDIFNKGEMERIRQAADMLLRTTGGYRNDDVYDLLVDEICIFYTRRQELANA